jgi:hypothetical protein
MKKPDLYYAVPCSTFALRHDVSLSLTSDSQLVALDQLTTKVLSCCHGFRTLEDHAAAAWRSGATRDPLSLASAMSTLLESGLLRAATDIQIGNEPNDSQLATHGQLDIVAFVTADRPNTLARGLASAIKHAQTFQHRPRFLVVDGSQELMTETREATIDMGASTECEVEYVGRNEAMALLKALEASGIARNRIESALTPGSIGSNRNLALLLSAGERLLMIDDDILCDVWLPPAGGSSEIVLGGHTDLREWRFFESRDGALSAVTPVDHDLLSAHGELLGMPLDRLFEESGGVELPSACGHIVSAVTQGRRCVVRVTMAGLAGDSARYCAHRLLFLPGTIRELFHKDPATITIALNSREVHVVASRPTVIHDPGCTSYCMGVSNDRLVPPFMPIGRGEDTVFGAMLGFADTEALFAHLGCGVVHDSSRPSGYGTDRMPSARQTRISEFLLLMLSLANRTAISTTVAERLYRFGHDLIELSKLGCEEFVSLVAKNQLHFRCTQIATLEVTLANIPNCPIELLAAFDEYCDVFRSSAADPAFFLPIEFHGPYSTELGFMKMQAFLGEFGGLIQVWPDVWNAAALANRGRAR